MKEMCIKAVNDFGSRLDQLIYSTGEVIHNAICVGTGKHTTTTTTRTTTRNCILPNK